MRVLTGLTVNIKHKTALIFSMFKVIFDHLKVEWLNSLFHRTPDCLYSCKWQVRPIELR